jgi:hypothetical protein
MYRKFIGTTIYVDIIDHKYSTVAVSVVWRLNWGVISGSDHEVDESCALLSCSAVCSGNVLPTLWENLSVPSACQDSKIKPAFELWNLYREECEQW